MDMPDLTTLLLWLSLVVIAGILTWEWGADWYEEFRREDDEWWESLTDDAKQILQEQINLHNDRLDEHDKKIKALDTESINEKQSGSGNIRD